MSADERAASNSLDVLEAIKNLPPELREIIYKDFVAIKQREREALGWTKVHKQILKSPFCHFKQQIVRIAVSPCLSNPIEKYSCFLCLEEGGLTHEVTMNPPIEEMDFIENLDEYIDFFTVLEFEMAPCECLEHFDDDDEDDKADYFLHLHLTAFS